MITLVENFTPELKNFFEKNEISTDKIEKNFAESVWIIQSCNENGLIDGILCYSFMYSTWTRYNPFILLQKGENARGLVKCLSENFRRTFIRGAIMNDTDDIDMFVHRYRQYL